MTTRKHWQQSVAVYNLLNEGGEAVLYPTSTISKETLVDDLAESLNEAKEDMMAYHEVNMSNTIPTRFSCGCDACTRADSFDRQVKEAIDYLDREIKGLGIEITHVENEISKHRATLSQLKTEQSLCRATKDAILDDIFGNQGPLEEELFNREEEEAMLAIHEDIAGQFKYEGTTNVRSQFRKGY